MVPEEAYSSGYLREEPLDKSYDFISQCASQGYHIRWTGLGPGGAGGGAPGWGGAGGGAVGGAGGGALGGDWASPPHSHPSPSSSSQFCRDAASSLSLFYNNGARPCGCHEMGATGPTCEPFGGQCPCRAHVIGRDCSRCATGYWGFPSCRRE